MVNRVTLIGFLGHDPSMRYTQSGSAICTFSLATSEKWKDKEGNKKEETAWHNIVAFNRLAEVCGEFLKKGSKVYIEGSIKYEKYEKDGQEKHITKIVAREMKMLGVAGGKQDSGVSESSAGNAEKAQQEDMGDIPF